MNYDFYQSIRSMHRAYEALYQNKKQLNQTNMKIELQFPQDSDKLEMISKAETNHFIVSKILDGSIRDVINVPLHNQDCADTFDRTILQIAEYIKNAHR